ncbi:MAG: CIA30 family protein [Phaeodactylibacter sp.]|uniref:CIA30 family protein n=1 Tax=Phaeodactylibacter sp. TaxID=1940289 RepID=UPI0032EC105C
MTNKMIIESFSPDAQLNWQIVNDGVMGGISTSRMQVQDAGYGQFSGSVSLENNGGFASCRAVVRQLDLAGTTGVRLRVRGDGQIYEFRVRVEGPYNRVAYRAGFTAEKGDWQSVELPWSAFQPTFRGRLLNDVPPITADDIREIGFLIANKQTGAFELEIDEISAY